MPSNPDPLLAALEWTAPHTDCRLGQILAKLTPEQRARIAELLPAIAVPKKGVNGPSAQWLVGVLAGAGHVVSGNTVRDHARGVCSCAR